MGITDQQREERRNYIGASDAPAICGVSGFSNAGDIYEEKVHGTDPKTSEAMEIGNDCEPMLIAWTANQVGSIVMPNVTKRVGMFVAHLDGTTLINGEVWIVEAKTTGLEGWGDDEEDPESIPPAVICQAAVQLYCYPEAVGVLVPAFIGRFGLRRQLFRITRDDLEKRGIIKSVIKTCTAFWSQNIQNRVAPPGDVPSMETLARVRRVPGKTVDWANNGVACAEVINAEQCRQQRLTAEKREQEAKARVARRMGDAEQATCEVGVITFFQQVQEVKAKGAYVKKFRKLVFKLNQ